VPVGFEVARELRAPLDVCVVRKLGVPGHEELAMGAIAVGGLAVLNQRVISSHGISPRVIDEVLATEGAEIERRERVYRSGRPPPPVMGQTVIVVDDGLATGSTMHAAVLALRKQAPARIIATAPVGSRTSSSDLRAVADDVVCLFTPEHLYAVGLWYADFSQTSDEDVRKLLARAARELPAASPSPTSSRSN
jgi:predicted phosphoribosyltransferase